MDRPIFIGGSGSSGSTLLSILLNRHPDVACGPELSFFNKQVIYGSDFSRFNKNFFRWKKYGVNTSGFWLYPAFFQNIEQYCLHTKELQDFLEKSKDLKSFIHMFVSAYLERKGKSRFAEKTPSNAYCYSNIIDMYPDAKVIHMLRDGRDVYCSLKKRNIYSPFLASSTWLYNTVSGLNVAETPNYFELRYEDLVTEPQQTMKRVCEHIEVSYSDDIFISSKDERIETTRRGYSTWNYNPRDNIKPYSVGRYKKEMTPEDERIFWNTALTKTGIKKLSSNINNNRELMHMLNYASYAEQPYCRSSVSQKISSKYIHAQRLMRSLRNHRGYVPNLTRI